MTDLDIHDSEHAELQRLAYEGSFLSIVAMLETYAGLAADWGVAPVTIETSGHLGTDIVAMHRAVHAMAGAVLAIADARPAVTN